MMLLQDKYNENELITDKHIDTPYCRQRQIDTARKDK